MVQAYNLPNSALAPVLCCRNFSAFIWPLAPASGERAPQEQAVQELDVNSNGTRREPFPFFLSLPFSERELKEHTSDLTIHIWRLFLYNIVHTASLIKADPLKLKQVQFAAYTQELPKKKGKEVMARQPPLRCYMRKQGDQYYTCSTTPSPLPYFHRPRTKMELALF